MDGKKRPRSLWLKTLINISFFKREGWKISLFDQLQIFWTI